MRCARRGGLRCSRYCLYGWRLYFALNRAPLPSRWLVLGVAAVAMLGVWLEYRTLFGRQSGILLLMLFSGLKLLETRSHRDAAVAGFLGYFLIITNFLYTQTIPIAALACVALVLITDHADRLQRAAARAARQRAHRGPAARACGARRARPLPAVPARARPAVGPAAGCVCRHDRAVRHHEPGQPREPRAIRRHRLSRRVPG